MELRRNEDNLFPLAPYGRLGILQQALAEPYRLNVLQFKDTLQVWKQIDDP